MSLKKQYEWLKNKLYLEGGFSFANFTLLNGLFLIGFALALGADNLEIGIIMAIPLFANLIQIISAFILEFTGTKKKTAIYSLVLGRLLWIPIILIGLGIYETSHPILAVMAVLLLSSFLSAIGNLSLLSWMKDLVPMRKLARFWGKRNLYATAGGAIVYLTGSFVIDYYTGLRGFAYIFTAALILGIAGIAFLIRIPEKQQKINAIKLDKMLRRWSVPFKDPEFRPLLYFGLAWGFAINIASPFFLVYMIDDLGLSFILISLFVLADYISRLIGLNLWGALADRYGARPVLAVSATVTSCIPLSFLFVNSGNYYIILPIFIISAFSYAAVDIAVGQILFKSAPRRYDAYYLSSFTSLTGLISAIGPIIGGYLAVFVKENSGMVLLDFLPALKYIFLVSFILRVSCIPMISRIHEKKAGDVQDILRRMRTLRMMSFFVSVYNFAEYASKIVLVPQKQFFLLQRNTFEKAKKDISSVMNKMSKLSLFLKRSKYPAPERIEDFRSDLDRTVKQLDYMEGSDIQKTPERIVSRIESFEKKAENASKREIKKSIDLLRKALVSAQERLKRTYKRDMEKPQ
ncbi:MFS transporter [Candidatus Woesearchaeota archaeon]|nr:MFS transporter [Candidatus Woesearchaeota archaeon]